IASDTKAVARQIRSRHIPTAQHIKAPQTKTNTQKQKRIPTKLRRHTQKTTTLRTRSSSGSRKSN
ncbi:hypothetical protein, partial [uncultured Roseobacter sp.]|uniref:hypothetical protein n=1 Tax=uncultured Roseobacter sp. TaxID=114847 RepID=UPI00260D2EDE